MNGYCEMIGRRLGAEQFFCLRVEKSRAPALFEVQFPNQVGEFDLRWLVGRNRGIGERVRLTVVLTQPQLRLAYEADVLPWKRSASGQRSAKYSTGSMSGSWSAVRMSPGARADELFMDEVFPAELG